MVSKNAGAESLGGALQHLEEHFLPLFVQQVGLFEEGIFVDGLLVQSPSVFRQPQGAVGPDQLGQIDGIDEGVGDRQAGVLGIDVNGGDVELEVGEVRIRWKRQIPWIFIPSPGRKTTRIQGE